MLLRIRNQGFSLIEVLISLGIVSAMMLALVELFTSSTKSIVTARATLSRDYLVSLVQMYLTSGAAMSNSLTLAANADLIQCVDGTPNANGCNSASTYSFTLLPPYGTTPVTGTTVSPAYYDASGAPCTPPSNLCILQATTTFTANCPGGTPTCTTAQSLNITYQIGLVPGAQLNMWGRLANKSTTIVRNVLDVSNGTVSCPVGKVVTGLNSDGSLICN